MLIERATTHLLSWPSALAYESQLSRVHTARFQDSEFQDLGFQIGMYWLPTILGS